MSAEDEAEYLKLPVEDRCVHKNWKARVSGYEECKKLFVRVREMRERTDDISERCISKLWKVY